MYWLLKVAVFFSNLIELDMRMNRILSLERKLRPPAKR